MPATYEPIATTTLGSAASSITFSTIPATYTDLRISFTPAGGSGANSVFVQFNSDTGTNYSRTALYGDGATATSARNTTQARITYAAAMQATYPEFFTLDVFSYAGSTYKTCLGTQSSDANGSGYTASIVGLWRSTSAITSLSLNNNGGNFATGTTATLYGIKAA
jgi:hypothetical protein